MDGNSAYRFAYDPPIVRHGPGCVENVGGELAGFGFDDALVVCGRTVGDRSVVMDPIREGLGDRLAGVFDETTPAKRLETAIGCASRAEELGADVLVGLGGASSLDVARVASALVGSDRTPEELGAQLAATATLSVPETTTPVVAVPTTLAGGGLSMLAGVSADPASGLVEEPVGGGVGATQLMPELIVYDPELVATTPWGVLAGSAMNGFNKGVETLYASNRTPITDATALEGLSLLSEALGSLGPKPTPGDLDTALRGVTLAQYGATRESGTTFSVLHALGHSLRIHADVQLGVGHAAVAPESLAWLLENADGRRDLLAEALGIEGSENVDDEIVAAVRSLRDGLDLPERLRDVEGIDRSVFEDVATMAADAFVLANDAPNSAGSTAEPLKTAHPWSGSPHPPSDLDVSTEGMKAILEAAW